MKAYGYGFWERTNSVLGGYRLFAILGFAVGTVYQHFVLLIMMNFVYKNLEAMPEYSFNVPIFFIVLAAFIVLYECATLLFAYKSDKGSVKEIMMEN